jgi:acetyl-CoA carboxylase biotin carboxyl carrier protein
MAKRPPDWLQVLQRVVAEVSASDVAEFELAQRGFRLHLRRNVSARLGASTSEPQRSHPTGVPILAPLTGIFYRSASPTAEAYVREGEWIEAGATVGLIETMKIFNEVKAEQPGRIERVLVASGQLVQAGEPLILLAPGVQPDEAGRPL